MVLHAFVSGGQIPRIRVVAVHSMGWFPVRTRSRDVLIGTSGRFFRGFDHCYVLLVDVESDLGIENTWDFTLDVVNGK